MTVTNMDMAYKSTLIGCLCFLFAFCIWNSYGQNSSNISFFVGKKKIIMSSNGNIISVSENVYNTPTNNKITTSYRNISVKDNREISIWKENNFPSVLYFPIGKHLLIREYHDNNIMLAALEKLANTRQIIENLDTIEIIGACSPVGSEEYNLTLALSRCMAVRSYLRWKHLSFAERFPIQFNIVGVDKQGYRILKNQKNYLSEKQIWDMLQYAAIRLKMKDGSYIIPGSERQALEELSGNRRDTVFIQGDTIRLPVSKNKASHKTSNAVHIALKNNLLYDAVLLPNLTVEWYMGKQWSLAIEGNWSWWTFKHPIQNRWYHRIQAFGMELRKWLQSPYPLQGHALGIYSMLGNYDIRLFTENEYSKGWLSYLSWSAGLSYAYSVPVSSIFNLEFGMAFGYVGGQYYKYDYCLPYDHWAHRTTSNRHYFGPTRASISLVWLLGTGNKNVYNE
jgi:outer membrane protein OmpA-like peptidoglycan-associated protein